MKEKLPEDIEKEMVLYRAGWQGLPRSYIDFHRILAISALGSLINEHKLILHRTYENDDGWLDGMRVLYAIVEQRNGNLIKISWNDGSQKFFEHSQNHGGSWPYVPNRK